MVPTECFVGSRCQHVCISPCKSVEIMKSEMNLFWNCLVTKLFGLFAKTNSWQMVFPRSAAGLPYMCACPEKHDHFWRICPRISSRNLAVCYGKGSLYIQTRRNMLIFYSKLFNYQCLHVSCPGLMLGRWNFTWLVVSTPLKNISQWEGLLHILWKIKAMLETTNQWLLTIINHH